MNTTLRLIKIKESGRRSREDGVPRTTGQLRVLDMVFHGCLTVEDTPQHKPKCSTCQDAGW
jgi:hypothetical protein